MARDLNAIFERMIENMRGIASVDDLVNPKSMISEDAIKYIPLRYRIIALGFYKRYSLKELNEKLEQNGCPRLYMRNFWEATLIFAFLNGYSYDEWKRMQEKCAGIYDSVQEGGWFSKKITYEELERYVLQNSTSEGDKHFTDARTALLEDQIVQLSGDEEGFRAFLQENVRSFSPVRERARYYFCKYLYYYLNAQIENYFAAVRLGRGVNAALSALMPLKVVTLLRKHKGWSEEKKRACIRESKLSCGTIFDEFNYFYFGYVSLDWVEILTECYPDVHEIPEEQRKRIAAVFRKRRPDFANLSDEEVIIRRMKEIEDSGDDIYSLDGSHGYGANRSGEHAVYKYIQGTLDIDRTALICFLLFFAAKSGRLPREHRLSEARLREILVRCGYAPLDIENDFDWFAVEFLESRRPVLFLNDVMAEYAHRSENSFLYHLYNNSINYERELVCIMLRNKSAGAN